MPGPPRTRPSSSGRPAADSGPARGPAPAGRYRASRRASAVASATGKASGHPTAPTPPAPSVQESSLGPTSRRTTAARRPPAGWRPHAQHRRARDRGPRAGAGRVVDDHEQVRLRRSGARGTARELGLPPLPDVVGPGRDHPHRPDGVAEPRMPGVRQPLDPLPLRRQVRGGDHREQRVRGAVPQHVLRDQSPRQCAGVLGPGARCRLEPDRRRPVQRQGDREVGDDRVRPQEPAQGERRHRLEPVHRTGLRRDQCGGQPLRAGPRAQQAEVRVGAPPFPQPPGCEHRGPGGGIGMHVLQGRPLLRDDDPDPPAGRCQVPQVVAPLLVHRRLPLTRAPSPAADEQHPDRRQREHAAEQQRRRIARTQRDETDRTQQHHPGQQPGEERRRDGPLGLGWRLDRELAAGHPRDGARRPRNLDRGHRASVPAVRARYRAVPATSAKRPRGGPQRGDSRQPHRQFVAVPQNR